MSDKRALVTGAAGQDGAYLAQALIAGGYDVMAATRRGFTSSLWRLEELEILDKVRHVEIDLLKFSDIETLLETTRPTVIYNLAARSFVPSSFSHPLDMADADALGALRLLEAIRAVDPAIRFYQASSSEMFGDGHAESQTETTPFHPRNPYGMSKLFAHWACMNYRESFGIFAASGILYNHESPLRGRQYVTRKITSHLALYKRIKAGTLRLGNLDAARDWGHARDYVQGMIAMMECGAPNTYVLASGRTHTVRQFVETAARVLGIDLVWEGEGLAERAIDRADGRVAVEIASEFYRETEANRLCGDATKARTELGWMPRTSFGELVEEMVRADLSRVDAGKPLL